VQRFADAPADDFDEVTDPKPHTMVGAYGTMW
jgi:hypothetical protein